MKMQITLEELVHFLQTHNLFLHSSSTDTTVIVRNFASLLRNDTSSLCWTKKPLDTTNVPNCAVLIAPEMQKALPFGPVILYSDQPRLAFAEALEHFMPLTLPEGVDTTAQVHPSAQLGTGVFIGPGCVVGAGAIIGDGSRLDSRVVLYEGVVIGKYCHVSAGAVLGADGHGYVLDQNRCYRKIRHIGSVVLGDYVDVGANSCIDRGVLDDTTIGSHTKIDNLVQIAHNVKVGDHCIITAGVIVAGSCTVGDYCWLAPGSVLKNSVNLPDEVLVGMNAVVYRSVRQGQVCLTGNPAEATLPYSAK